MKKVAEVQSIFLRIKDSSSRIVPIPLDSLDNKEIKFNPAIPPAAKLFVNEDHPLDRLQTELKSLINEDFSMIPGNLSH